MAVKGENGMKKKFYQKWWFWLIIALPVIGAVGNAMDESKTPAESAQPLVCAHSCSNAHSCSDAHSITNTRAHSVAHACSHPSADALAVPGSVGKRLRAGSDRRDFIRRRHGRSIR